jgi:MFS family permease
LGVGICSLLSLLIPVAAKTGAGYVISIRILQGLSQGVIFPSMHAMWSKWSPPFERSRLTTFALRFFFYLQIILHFK